MGNFDKYGLEGREKDGGGVVTVVRLLLVLPYSVVVR